MTQRDDFEHRLGQGLKRWAEDGRPTLDLEAYVKAQADVDNEAQSELAVVPPGARVPKRRQTWITAVAAAAVLLLATTFSFPLWAGAAAELPLVGPVLQEFILKDAGLKWAYENNLIHGTLAEADLGPGKVKILGVMADARRTTVIYQVTGLPAPAPSQWDSKPIKVGEAAPPRAEEPEVFITAVDGQGASAWRPSPKHTPVGYVGITSTTALQTESAELVIGARYGGETTTLKITASRAETDKFSREVAVNQSQTVDDITVTVQSVIYTPAETLVRYQISRPDFFGMYSPVTNERMHLAAGGKELLTGAEITGINDQFITAFPVVKGHSTLVIPAEVKGVPADLMWPLEAGATQEANGVTVTLEKWTRSGDEVEFEWSLPNSAALVGFSGFEVVDAAGNSADFRRLSEGSGFWEQNQVRHITYSSQLPPGFQPVAIRAKSIGVEVVGPWRFDLPR